MVDAPGTVILVRASIGWSTVLVLRYLLCVSEYFIAGWREATASRGEGSPVDTNSGRGG